MRHNWTVWRCQVHLHISLTFCGVIDLRTWPCVQQCAFYMAFGTTLKRRRCSCAGVFLLACTLLREAPR